MPMLAQGAFGAPAFAMPPLLAPSGPQVLSRRLERSLRGDARLVIERRWRIAFSPQGRRIAITGTQIAAEVEAPEVLAPMAAIERNRPTDTMWPIVLSDEGRIVGAGEETRQEDFDAMLRKAREVIATLPIPPAERSAKQEGLASLKVLGTSLLERLPDDLFVPSGQPQHQARTVALPGGLTGEYELTYEAQSAPGSPWLARAVRQVTTRVEGTEDRSREEWTLAPL